MELNERIKYYVAALQKRMDEIGIVNEPQFDRGFLRCGLEIDSSLTPEQGCVVTSFHYRNGEPDVCQLEIYTTAVDAISPAALPELEQAILRWNHGAVMGCWGIRYSNLTLYHRQLVMVNSTFTPEEAAQEALCNLSGCMFELQDQLKTAWLLAEGKLTFEQTQAEKLC